MGNTFEIWTWQFDSDGYKYRFIWGGEDQAEAFEKLKCLKATGDHPCLKLEWR